MNGQETPEPGRGASARAEAEADHQSFDTSVAHVARVYDYWLGGRFL
jgi:hypothetical protein